MKRAWIILGEANTKKSSVIRTLTGLPKINDGGIPGFVQIEQTNGLRFSLLSYISAMQEAKISPEELLKKIELSNTRQLRKLKNTTDPTKEHR
ncbi:hypothetical protein, partial [Nisaea nitritireducens]|uniref:hypothetical protein n=1 Tax=Nisaea nitritireducens TaxID=568392 RepID=UPI0018686E1B